MKSNSKHPDRIVLLMAISLVAVGAVAVCLLAERKRRAVIGIQNSGASVIADSASVDPREFPDRIRELHIEGDRELVALRSASWLRRLRLVHIRRCKLSSRYAQRLRELPPVERVVLTEVHMSNDAFCAICEMTTLRALFLNRCDLKNLDLRALSRIRGLKVLGIHGHRNSDDIVGRIRGHAQLEVLDLARTDVTDRVATLVKACPRLRNLDLSHTKVSGNIVPRLLENRNITQLDLSNTNLGIAGKEKFTRVVQLNRLYLCDTVLQSHVIDYLRTEYGNVIVEKLP